MSEKPILYNLNISPPVRSVKIIARLIDLELEIRDLDLFHGEHLQEPFIKLNPEHTVPTLDDNGNIIWDSHAINTYLIDKYAADDSLYPKDLVLRAKCNQRLFFNNGTLFQRFRAISRHVFGGGDEIPEALINAIYDACDLLEANLETDPFLVGEQLTVADVCTAVTTTSLNKLTSIDESRYPNIIAWLNRVKEEISFFDELNEQYANEYFEMLQASMEKHQQQE